jgi:hypothetical protein
MSGAVCAYYREKSLNSNDFHYYLCACMIRLGTNRSCTQLAACQFSVASALFFGSNKDKAYNQEGMDFAVLRYWPGEKSGQA